MGWKALTNDLYSSFNFFYFLRVIGADFKEYCFVFNYSIKDYRSTEEKIHAQIYLLKVFRCIFTRYSSNNPYEDDILSITV